MTLGERIVVLKDGIIMQVGTPMELYVHPQNLFVAGFIGSPPMNLIYGTMENAGKFLGKNGKPLMQLPASMIPSLKTYEGRNIYMGIRPENITETAPKADKTCCSVNVSVTGVERLGSEILLYARVEDTPLIARLSPTSLLNPGGIATLNFNLENSVFFDADSGIAL
jgi:multiple sugar transport system ATP-binding protein